MLVASADGLLASPAVLVWARRDSDLPVIIEDHGITWSWRQLANATAAVADALPVVAGERVAFSAPNGGAFVALLCGIWAAGGVPAPVSSKLPVPERAKVLATIGAISSISTADLGLATNGASIPRCSF